MSGQLAVCCAASWPWEPHPYLYRGQPGLIAANRAILDERRIRPRTDKRGRAIGRYWVSTRPRQRKRAG